MYVGVVGITVIQKVFFPHGGQLVNSATITIRWQPGQQQETISGKNFRLEFV